MLSVHEYLAYAHRSIASDAAAAKIAVIGACAMVAAEVVCSKKLIVGAAIPSPVTRLAVDDLTAVAWAVTCASVTAEPAGYVAVLDTTEPARSWRRRAAAEMELTVGLTAPTTSDVARLALMAASVVLVQNVFSVDAKVRATDILIAAADGGDGAWPNAVMVCFAVATDTLVVLPSAAVTVAVPFTMVALNSVVPLNLTRMVEAPALIVPIAVVREDGSLVLLAKAAKSVAGLASFSASAVAVKPRETACMIELESLRQDCVGLKIIVRVCTSSMRSNHNDSVRTFFLAVGVDAHVDLDITGVRADSDGS